VHRYALTATHLHTVAFLAAEHLLPIAATLAAAALCIWVPRRHPGRPARVLRSAVALVIAVVWAGEYVADVVLGIWSTRYTLPLQLTDATSIVAVIALLTVWWRAVELAYLWSMTAGLQAILTPDLGYTFPSIFYFTYFGYHCGALIAGWMLVFGEGRYLRAGAVRRAYLIALGWTCLAAIGDLATGGNYMYLHDKPEHVSLLNVMGPWPWYVLETALLVAPLLLCAAWGLAALVERLAGTPARVPA
jgi:hypothetical integral membrane protein (TIGR02206 family)